jgi:hypothetical protein
MSAFEVALQGAGLHGPGLPSWLAGRRILRGEEPYASTHTVLAPPPRLPPAERRRAGPSIRLAMAVADEAVAHARIDLRHLATVFASSAGEGTNCHALCERLAGADRHISPTRFTNSIHNAPAGFWHIAVASQAASTSLSAYDGSFAAGLIEAVTQVRCARVPVLLVACDVPYPEPLHSMRTLPDPFGLALLLTPPDAAGPMAWLAIDLVDASCAAPSSRCANSELDALRRSVPAAAALPLLEAVANSSAQPRLVLDYLPAVKLRVAVNTEARPS